MTFPNFPFPPNTPLFPSHTHVRSYLSSAVSHFNLAPFLRLNTSVVRAAWGSQHSEWDVDLEVQGEVEKRRYDSLVVATGRYHHPSVPSWPGQREWLEAGEDGPSRSIQHSLWYRGPEAYRDAVVVVVGFGASGWDTAQQTVLVAKQVRRAVARPRIFQSLALTRVLVVQVYHSYTIHPDAPGKLPPVPGTIHKPRISHFSSSTIHFIDGSTLVAPRGTPIRLVLATGYSLSIPFLSPHLLRQHALDAAHPHPPGALETNGMYLRPLWRDVLAVPEGLPPTALGVVGLPWYVAAAQASYIQGLVLAHALASSTTLVGPVLGRTAQEMRDEVEHAEVRRRNEEGVEPFVEGQCVPVSLSMAPEYSLLTACPTRPRSAASSPRPAKLKSTRTRSSRSCAPPRLSPSPLTSALPTRRSSRPGGTTSAARSSPCGGRSCALSRRARRRSSGRATAGARASGSRR